MLTRRSTRRSAEQHPEDSTEGKQHVTRAKPPIHPDQHFPHLKGPAHTRYIGSHLRPLAENDRSSFVGVTPFADIHRRLLRAMADCPTVAIYPYLIYPIHAGGQKLAGTSGGKDSDQAYSFVFANFMDWPLEGRGLRLGLAMSEPLGGQGSEPLHVFVIGVYGQGRGGKRVFFWDDSAEDAFRVNDKYDIDTDRQDMTKKQRDIIDILRRKKGHDGGRGVVVNEVWYGGEARDVDMSAVSGKKDMRCLELAVRFIEQFSRAIEEDNGRVEQKTLRLWKMREMHNRQPLGAWGASDDEEVEG